MQLALVKLADGLIETFQEGKALGSDARLDDTAVSGLARARDEAAFFHAVEKAGHVRIVRNHALADSAARQTFGFGAAKNAKNVVLRTGKGVGLEELLGFEAKGVGGLLQRNEDASFDGKRWPGCGAGTHGHTIVVMTTNVNRKIDA